MRRGFVLGLLLATVALGPGAGSLLAQDTTTYTLYQPLTLTQRPNAVESAQHASFLRDVTLNLETVELADKMIWTFGFTNRNPAAVGHFFFQVDAVYLLDAAGRRYDGTGPVAVQGDPRQETQFVVPFSLPPPDVRSFTVSLSATHAGDHDEVPHAGHVWETQVTLDESQTQGGKPAASPPAGY
jgi:hypothetical protein